MATILNDLIDLSRARRGGGISVDVAPCELSSIALTVVEEMRSTHEGADIVSRSVGNLEGAWDSGRLQQVMSNLLGNALRHGEPGGAVTLTLDGSAPEVVKIAVHNQGQIQPEVRSRMFEPFSGSSTYRRGQSDPPSRETASRDGLGLGLYIVSQIVRAHGGKVDVDSSASSGTTFLVSLPRGQAALPGPGFSGQ
jgi:signal transduction histidine kinase